MRILLTAHRFHPHVGGTEFAVDQLATQFAAHGHDVTVATSAEPDVPAQDARNGYAIERFEMRRVGKFRFPPASYKRLVTDRRWDIVHLHGQRVWSSDHIYRHFGRVVAPIIFTAHGFAQWHRKRVPVIDAAYYQLVLPRALRHVARVTALTQAEREDLIGWGVPASQIVRIGDGYDPSEFVSLPSGFRARYGFTPDEHLLMYAGGFYANKRVDRLVEAAAGLDATLIVFGADADGTRASLEAEASERGTRLRVLGRVPREDVLSAYRECDLFVLASDFEGYGLVLLEAMAAGLPFVSTPCGAAPMLAEAGGGLLVETPGAMRETLRALLADEARRSALGAQGRAAAPAFTWESIAEQYLDLFAEVLARH